CSRRVFPAAAACARRSCAKSLSPGGGGCARRQEKEISRKTAVRKLDRKSTRLNSSHSQISYAVFCLKKKKKKKARQQHKKKKEKKKTDHQHRSNARY